MNEQIAFCPKCGNEVVFMTSGNLRRCPVCAFQYQRGAPSANRYETPAALSFLGALLRVILIMAAIVAVVVGLLFIGCIAVSRF
jgi:hypothetical protein